MYTAQLILGRSTVWGFLTMSHEARMQLLGDIISEEDLVHRFHGLPNC